jgi:hypothetical protein
MAYCPDGATREPSRMLLQVTLDRQRAQDFALVAMSVALGEIHDPRSFFVPIFASKKTGAEN